MGGELLGSSLPEENKKRISISEVFWEAYPAYLTMGMSSDEYWNGDARACRAYRKKRETELRIQDETLWRQGAYIYHALICVAPYFNSIKPRKPEDYIEPFSYKQDIEKQQLAENRQMQRGMAAFHAWAENFNKARKNGNRT